MRSPVNSQRPNKSKHEPRRPLGLQEVLQSLRLVLEMEPDHLDGAIDLLDEAINRDQRMPQKICGCRS